MPTTYRVSGTLTPDATGDYAEAGTHNEKPYYRRGADEWYLWYQPGRDNLWVLSAVLGIGPPNDCWMRVAEAGIVGEYQIQGAAVGTATVSEVTIPTATRYLVLSREIEDGGHEYLTLQEV